MLKSFVGSVCNHFDICCEKKVYWNWVSRKRSMILSISFTISRFFFSPFHITLHSSRVHSSVRSRSLFGVTTTTTCTHISRERAVGSRTRVNTSFHFTQFPSRSRPFSQISLLFHSLRRSNVHLVLISYPYRMACWEYTEALCTSADNNESEREKQQRIYVITHGTDEEEWEKPDLWAYFSHVRCLTMCPILLCSVSFRSLLSFFSFHWWLKLYYECTLHVSFELVSSYFECDTAYSMNLNIFLLRLFWLHSPASSRVITWSFFSWQNKLNV